MTRISEFRHLQQGFKIDTLRLLVTEKCKCAILGIAPKIIPVLDDLNAKRGYTVVLGEDPLYNIARDHEVRFKCDSLLIIIVKPITIRTLWDIRPIVPIGCGVNRKGNRKYGLTRRTIIRVTHFPTRGTLGFKLLH